MAQFDLISGSWNQETVIGDVKVGSKFNKNYPYDLFNDLNTCILEAILQGQVNQEPSYNPNSLQLAAFDLYKS